MKFDDILKEIKSLPAFPDPCFIIHPYNAVDFRRVLGTYSPAPIGKIYGMKVMTSKRIMDSPLTYVRNERKVTWGGGDIYTRIGHRKSEGRALMEKWRYNHHLNMEDEYDQD